MRALCGRAISARKRMQNSQQYYPQRKAIVLEPDERPPSLEIEPPSGR